MNALSDFLKWLAAKLSEAEIPFMLVRSVAASYHGHPRSTLDIDVVVDADEETLCRFARSMGEGYYVSEESVRQAFRSRAAFNVIDCFWVQSGPHRPQRTAIQSHGIQPPHESQRLG